MKRVCLAHFNSLLDYAIHLVLILGSSAVIAMTPDQQETFFKRMFALGVPKASCLYTRLAQCVGLLRWSYS